MNEKDWNTQISNQDLFFTILYEYHRENKEMIIPALDSKLISYYAEENISIEVLNEEENYWLVKWK